MARAAPNEDWPQTVAEFEAWHARQPERWEFIDGRPRLMAPGSMRHSILKNNAGFALRQALQGRGTALIGPQIVTDDISAIPDVVATCTPLDHSSPAIAQPTIIVEVMPPRGEADDTGRKWQAYQKIGSLRHYILLSQDQRLVNVHSRAGDPWRERFLDAGVVELDAPRSGWRSTTCTRRPTSPHSFLRPPVAGDLIERVGARTRKGVRSHVLAVIAQRSVGIVPGA